LSGSERGRVTTPARREILWHGRETRSTAIDKAGQKVASGVLEIEKFGQSSAARYADAFLEGEETCADDLTVIVEKATAVVDGKRTDLLKTGALSARDFKPFRIRVGK